MSRPFQLAVLGQRHWPFKPGYEDPLSVSFEKANMFPSLALVSDSVN